MSDVSMPPFRDRGKHSKKGRGSNFIAELSCNEKICNGTIIVVFAEHSRLEMKSTILAK